MANSEDNKYQDEVAFTSPLELSTGPKKLEHIVTLRKDPADAFADHRERWWQKLPVKTAGALFTAGASIVGGFTVFNLDVDILLSGFKRVVREAVITNPPTVIDQKAAYLLLTCSEGRAVVAKIEPEESLGLSTCPDQNSSSDDFYRFDRADIVNQIMAQDATLGSGQRLSPYKISHIDLTLRGNRRGTRSEAEKYEPMWFASDPKDTDSPLYSCNTALTRIANRVGPTGCSGTINIRSVYSLTATRTMAAGTTTQATK